MMTKPAELPPRAMSTLDQVPLHDAEALTRGGSCAVIRLGDQLYTLRITKMGKLILTK